MGKNFVFVCVLVFIISSLFFSFHSNSATTNTHWRELSDISCQSSYSLNLNDVKHQKHFSVSR